MKKGLTNVAALKGGWAAWLRAGYPVEGKLPTNPPPQPTALPTATPQPVALPPIRGDEAGVLGSSTAPVTIFEFSDFQCPYCGRHALTTLPKIKETYIDSGQVRYVFKDFPLSFHPNAPKAAEAARCAGAQGAFWEMHDRLFMAQGKWSSLGPQQAMDAFVQYAGDLELDRAAFRTCLETGQFAAQVRQDMQDGQKAGVRGTPSFLINGRLLVGAYSFDQLRSIIEAELQKGR